MHFLEWIQYHKIVVTEVGTTPFGFPAFRVTITQVCGGFLRGKLVKSLLANIKIGCFLWNKLNFGFLGFQYHSFLVSNLKS